MAGTQPNSVPRLWRGALPERASVLAERARRRKIFLLQMLVMALAGAIFGMFYWIRPIPRSHLVSVTVSAPKNRLIPPDPNAAHDLQMLASGGYFAANRQKPVANQDQDQMVRSLGGLQTLWR